MATTKKTTTEETVEIPQETVTDPGEELVTIQLFKDNGKYSEDLFVAVNGERILIQRGVPVQIKRKFAEVINHSMYQDGQTERMLTEMAEAYETKTREQK